MKLMPNTRQAVVFMGCALALSAAATAPAMAEPLRALYSVRGGGMQVMQVEVFFDFDTPGRYAIRANWRTTGMARLFGSAEFSGGAEGRWAGNQAQPQRYTITGQYRGEPRQTVVDYPAGQPVLRVRLPQNDPEREPVPEAMQRNTTDQFTVLAQLTRLVAATGRCDDRSAIFDGARRVEMQMRTAGRDRLFPWSTAWHGEAVRCAFTGQQIAGFKVEGSEREREPQEGTAWFAPPRPGDVPIPVRAEIPSRFFGNMTVYLMEIGASPANALPADTSRAASSRATN
jgi:hypothetical protein